MKFFFYICILLCVALSLVSGNCSGKCPDTEEVVWALGGGCSVFRNKCYFDKENCHRKPALTITTKRECQRHCPDICTAVYQPTSGIYNGKVLNFGNECEKRAYTCRTGQTFL
ncbi:uncharacterized protein LOC26527090 [Drosophila erecta]|uniref:uncharacterized protein LOC26527090 n=1 Tax=Drosophila erecta TaxID=7220 RepID=UPI000732A072|nr:uncharacterized protein LOC26527090 [Drosophila erecta]KQS38877.1 uncharacterized protein Dere_GG27266 [Drosophila erecta]